MGCQRTSQQIAYLSNRNGNFDIFLSDADGKEHKALTTNPGWDWYPKWSPARQAIIYNSKDTAGTFSIRMMDQKGNTLPMESYGKDEFILSPDGKHALFTKRDSQYQYIYSLDIATQIEKPLITEKSYNGRPHWSPDSRYFVFITDRDGSNEIYLHELEAGVSTRLTTNELREKYMSWRTDGKVLLFTASREEESWNDVYQMEIATQKVQPLTQDELLYEEIALSRNGRLLAIHGQWEGSHHIYVLDLKNKNLRRITQANAYHGEPEWIGK